MHSQQILKKTLQSVATKKVAGTFFRAVDYDALTSRLPPNALWSGGPRQKGQRYTPSGGPGCLYLSETMETAIAEARGLFSTVANVSASQAIVVLSIQVQLDCVLDITVEETQLRLGTTLKELTASWEVKMLDNLTVPTHVLAEAAFESGLFQGIRFPSAQVEKQANLMIWTGLVTQPSFVEIFDRNSKLWRRIP